MQALLNILRFRGLPGCFVDFRRNVFQIVEALILVVLKANIGNCAVHQALLYVFPAFIPLVRNEFRRPDFKFLFGLLRHPVKLPLIRVGYRRLKRGNDVIFPSLVRSVRHSGSVSRIWSSPVSSIRLW